MTEEAVIYEAAERVATIRLNRPDRRNALAPQVIEGIISGLEQASADPEVWAVVLTGTGEKAFCAGGDLGGGMGTADGALAAHAQRHRFCELLQAVRDCPQPVIGALNGDALGGGIGLALACDMLVAEPTARLGTPEVKIGLFPMIIVRELARNVPRKVLAEMIYTGRKLSAEEARTHHLVNRISEPGQVLAEAQELASAVTANSPTAIALGKAAWNQAEELPLQAAEAWLLSRLELLIQTEDAAEGIGAFFQRRPPEWKGR